MATRLAVPFRVAKRAEAKAAAGSSYWQRTTERAQKKVYRDAVEALFGKAPQSNRTTKAKARKR
jgi:hypothetical protein